MSYRIVSVEFDERSEPETIRDKLVEEGLREEIFTIEEVGNE